MREGPPILNEPVEESPESQIVPGNQENVLSPEVEHAIKLVRLMSYDQLKKDIAANPALATNPDVVGEAVEMGASALGRYSMFVVEGFATVFPGYKKNPIIVEGLRAKVKHLIGLLDSSTIPRKLMMSFPDLMDDPEISKAMEDKLRGAMDSTVKKMLTPYKEETRNRILKAIGR